MPICYFLREGLKKWNILNLLIPKQILYDTAIVRYAVKYDKNVNVLCMLLRGITLSKEKCEVHSILQIKSFFS